MSKIVATGLAVALMLVAGVHPSATALPTEGITDPAQALLASFISGIGVPVPNPLAGCTPPSPPRDLLASPHPLGYRLTWSASTDPGTSGVSSYRVYRLDAETPLDFNLPVAVLGPGARSWIEPGGTAWTAVYIVVAASACGEGGYSDPTYIAGGVAEAQLGSPDYPHCIFLAIVNPPQSPYFFGPFLDCLLPLPGFM